MRESKRRGLRCVALTLAVCLLLGLIGCSSKPEDGGGQSSDGGTDAPLHDALPTGLLEGENTEISEEDSEKIARALEEMENLFLADPDGISVKQRNWGRYSSPLGKVPLTDAEADFYDRADAFCLEYLKNANRNAVKNSKLDDQWCAAGGIPYADLGLTSTEAVAVYRWLLYNCPQYYFFGAGCLSNSREIMPYVYTRWADGGERAEVTNELFDKLDGWIELIDQNAGTTYQKEYLTNDFLCETVTYDYESLEPDQLDKLWLNQSLYTAVVPENTVCAGYSKVFTAMMSAMDVPVTAGLSDGHAWNVALCDDQNYYCVDVCWNATGNNKLGYLNVGDATSKARDGEKESHVYRAPEDKWIPAISQVDYQPTEYDVKGEKVLVDMPSSLQITALNDGEHKNGLLIDWPDVENAGEYEFAIFTNSGYSEIMITNKGERVMRTEESEVKVWNLSPEKMYYYGIRALKTVDGREYSSDWNYFSERLDSVWEEENRIAQPTNVLVSSDPNSADTVHITWNGAANADRYEFALFRDSAHDELWKSWDKSSAAINLSKIKSSSDYYYGVRAIGSVDGEEYASNWTYGTFRVDQLSAEDGALLAPENLAVKQNQEKENGCIFTWNAVDGAEKYQFARFTDGTYTTIVQRSSGEMDIWDKEGLRISLAPFAEGQTYYYGVRAVKTVNGAEVCSDWTGVSFSLDNLKAASSQLPAPGNLTVKRSEEKEDLCTFTWDAVNGAEKYQFARFTDETYTTIKEKSSGGLSLWDEEDLRISLAPFTKGQTYHYGVRAVKTVDGKEVYSDWTGVSFSFR